MKKWMILFLVLSGILVACDEYADEFEDDWFPEDEETAAVDDEMMEAVSVDEALLDAEPGTFQPGSCPFSTSGLPEIECGVLIVPEEHGRADSPTLQLAVAIIYAAEANDNPPLLYLAGGPGGSAIDDYLADPDSWDYPFLNDRDFILLDQRGTGYSRPTLDCPEFADVDFDENPDALCYERLTAAGVNLTAFNTAENAADVAALRMALDIPEWDLLGISYGTRLALQVMAGHPAGIRAVILDSPFPPNADTPVEEVYSFTDALTELFADCERDAYCRDLYPDLETVFLETVDELNRDETAPIYGDDLIFALMAAFSETELIPLLPYVIYEVSEGNIDALDEISMDDGFRRPRYQAEDRSDSEGMFNSVICYDEYTTTDYERVEDTVVGTIPPELEGALLQSTFDMVQLCSFWNPRTAVDNTAVSSPIPSLILAGQYDVATPPRWARLTAATLPAGYLVEFPGAGHSLLSGVDCAVTISAEFLRRPDQRPNTDCLTDIEWPYFE